MKKRIWNQSGDLGTFKKKRILNINISGSIFLLEIFSSIFRQILSQQGEKTNCNLAIILRNHHSSVVCDRYKNMNRVLDGLQMFTIVVRTSPQKNLYPFLLEQVYGGWPPFWRFVRFVGCQNEEPTNWWFENSTVELGACLVRLPVWFQNNFLTTQSHSEALPRRKSLKPWVSLKVEK